MNEQVFVSSNEVEVIYRHQVSKYDFNHIIFVFSGFHRGWPGNYDFLKAFKDCPCDVVWINDKFDDMYSYYLCVDMDFRVEVAITEFMTNFIEKKKLKPQNVTVTGYSKGGSAALYYGLKLDIDNIVATVPQIYIGDYIDNNWQHVAEHMLGKDYSKFKIRFLDNLLPQMLIKDKKIDRNIYLLTSEVDEQYPLHILPNLYHFEKYTNFNLLKTHSLFVRQHSHVTSHHTALLLSIYYALASEAVPRFNNGAVDFFGRQELAVTKKPSGEPYVDLQKIEITEGKLFIEGIAILRGIDAEDYSDINYELHLIGKSSFSKKLAKDHMPYLSRQLFNEVLIAYDKCWFTTYKKKGIDIMDIDKGEYELWITIEVKGVVRKTRIVSSRLLKVDNKDFHFECDTVANSLLLK